MACWKVKSTSCRRWRVKSCDFSGIWCNKEKRTKTKTLEAGFSKQEFSKKRSICADRIILSLYLSVYLSSSIKFYLILYLLSLEGKGSPSSPSFHLPVCEWQYLWIATALPLFVWGRVCSLPSSQPCVATWTNSPKECFHPPIATGEAFPPTSFSNKGITGKGLWEIGRKTL